MLIVLELNLNHQDLLKKIQKIAKEIFGKKIYILSEFEEAKYIYYGATFYNNNKETNNNFSLVLDIGGGSTEIILGMGSKVLFLKSIPIGCVGINIKAIKNSKEDSFGEDYFEYIYKELELLLNPSKDILKPLLKNKTFKIIGCSGVIKQLFSIINFKKEGRSIISKLSLNCILNIKSHISNSLKGVKCLNKTYSSNKIESHASSISYDKINGLRGDRVQVFPAGLGILCALFEFIDGDILSSGVKDHEIMLEMSSGALREGLKLKFLEDKM